MKISEPLLFDSNILIYAHNEDSPFHLQAVKLIANVINGNTYGVLAFQNLLEFYSVITDKRRLSNPISPKLASELVNEYLTSPFEIIYPNFNTNEIIIKLLKEGSFRDGQIFDVYLIATMLSSNIKHVITANVADFKKFDNISVLDLTLDSNN